MNIKHNKTYEYVKSPRDTKSMNQNGHWVPPLAWAFRRGSLRNWATQRGRSSCGPRRLLRSLEDEVRGVKWVINWVRNWDFPWIHGLTLKIWLLNLNKFERFLQWWVIIGCSLITGCWANLFSVKTHVSNMQGAQADYHGTGSAQPWEPVAWVWLNSWLPQTQWSIEVYHHVSQWNYHFIHQRLPT